VLDVDLLDPLAQRERLARMDLDVRRLALETPTAGGSGSGCWAAPRALPGAPPARISDPIDIATPQHVVATFRLDNRIVS